ncbi:MAG: SAM-dependent methyltransferase [Candidatus Binatia bacterium]|jgi:methyltransferase (TIGR00027 family)
MNTGQASRTAEYMAFFRALESARPSRRRLFTDSFAVDFLRPALRRAVRLSRVPVLGALIPWYSDRRLPGARTSGVARTRLIDDALCQALREGIGQVLILGAGFDCRAYRLPGIGSAAVFEVDHPATLSVKRAHLHRVLAKLPENVRFVEMDFNRQGLRDTLTQAGLDPLRPAVFLWEGVTSYLTADAVDAVLRFVAGCAAGSRLIFTYIDRRALDGSGLFEGAADLMREVARLGEPWTFGLDPEELPDYLRERGLRLERDAGAREYRRQYFGPDGERMKGYDFYHVAIASVTRSF